MTGIISGLLPIALQIVGWILGRSAASEEMKQKFIELVSQYESETGNPVRLSDSARAQLERLKKDG